MAYASLVSLVNILEQNLELNLIPQNSSHIKTLLKEASLFQDFLEMSSHSSNENVNSLEIRIRDAAYKAQDIIESHARRFFLTSFFEESVVDSAECLFQDLDEVIKEINSIKQEVMQILEEDENNKEHELQSKISLATGSSTPLSNGITNMVGLDDDLMEIKKRLVSDSSQREVIALVGMGGIGKTTLAQKLYNEKSNEKSILSHFHIFGWTTVSQEYNVRNILLGLLDSMGKLSDELHTDENEKLSLALYKSLKHRRYLIVLDDVWDTQVWDYLKRILPNDENGSRILLTTRLNKVAEYDSNCPSHQVRFLNDKESWGLFCENVFGKYDCPSQLEKVGKEIVRNCRGFPLAVSVIAGHLSKATRTPQYWRSVANNLSETIALEDDEQCLRILSLSYKHLPHYLKGCFLYMSIFPEDCEIEVFQLVNLWIASGLIKEERSKSFEGVVKDYFLELVERNLILVSKRKYNGKILKCKIHDLIRDLCVREAKKEKFFHLIDKTLHHDFCYFDSHADVSPHSRLLRAVYLKQWGINVLSNMENQLINMRFLHYEPDLRARETALTQRKFLHLHTIHAIGRVFTLNVWEMPQLKHVKITYYVIVPDPTATKIDGEKSITVLGKLQTLCYVRNLIYTDEVLRRIQNVKKLGVEYFETKWRDSSLNNLERLHKLESLRCFFYGKTPAVPIHHMSFPHSMKKLTLMGPKLPWKDMTVIGSLQNLQVLKLKYESFMGEEWEPNEGEFLNLKTLQMSGLDLVHWRAEAEHFPMLQHLFICDCRELQEIPSAFGEIPTLQLIDVIYCRRSVETSTRQIEKEQHNFGNEDLQIITRMCF